MFTHSEVVQGPWAAGPGSEVGCQGNRCQLGLASCPASAVWTSSSPPAPSESCRFSLPAGGNTRPEGERWRRGAVRSTEIQHASQSSRTWGCGGGAYPRVGRLVHVALHLSRVSHQVLHPPILKCSWIRSGEDGLHAAHAESNTGGEMRGEESGIQHLYVSPAQCCAIFTKC